MKKKIKFGIVGCSRIAENSTLPAIIQSSKAEISMIGSRDTEKAKRFGKKFNCTQYGTYDDVLENDDVDAVYISVPVGLHEKWTLKSAKSGKHILCEKSSTDSYISAKKMILTSKRNNVRLMEGLMFRHHPSHKRVKQLIVTKLGQIYKFYGQYGFPSIPYSDIRYKKNLGGGVFNDVACYPISASRFIFEKEPEEVFGTFEINKKYQIDTKASITLKFSDKEIAHMSVGYDLHYQSFYSLWGNKGHLHLSRSYNIPPTMNPTIRLDVNGREKILSTKPANHFVLMINSFCNELLDIQKSDFNFENDLLQQAKIMDAIRKSVKNHKSVSV